jgi:Xaa-Pro aminopeptidase
MRKVFVFAVLLEILFLTQLGSALDRQPNADYRARRQALASKTNGGVVLLFAPTEAEGPNAVYGYRPDSNFFYLSGWTQPAAALLIAPAVEAKGQDPARPYTEILFLPAHNYTEGKWTGPKLGPENPRATSIT